MGEDQNTPDARRNARLCYKFQKPKMKVEEEFLVHDFVGMLGSIGGMFGLFIGFSLFGLICSVLEYLRIFLTTFIYKYFNERSNIDNKNVIAVSPRDNQDELKHLDLLVAVEHLKARILYLEDMHPRN